jgi:hypothetical protein
MNTKPLTEYIEKKLVMASWGDYEGIREPSVEDLLHMKTLVDFALASTTKGEPI